jgi:hypothetical protein
MTTTTDIANRALQMLGSRTNIASLAEQSNEAFQINLIYSIVTDWCFAATNWNFARKIAVLSLAKSFTGSPWSTTQPQPFWAKEYTLPTDFIRAIYLTDNSITNPGSFDGEPKRFVIATDTIAAQQQQVIMTNVTSANLVYTSRVSDPTNWPALFERFAVASVANAVAYQLTGDRAMAVQIRELMMSFFQIAEQQNVAEELLYTDVTPEWVQAIGIKYPMRRYGPRGPVVEPQQRQQNDNRR